MLGFCKGPADLNSSLEAYVASALFTEPPLRPSVHLFSKIPMRIRKVKVSILGQCCLDLVTRQAFLGSEG